MNFNSISEYFYKVYSFCFIIVLVPLCLQGLIQFQLIFKSIQPIFSDLNQTNVLGSFAVLQLTFLTIVHLYASTKLKRISKQLSLGKKLDDYFMLSIGRMFFGLLGCCTVIAAYLFTQLDTLNIFFFLIICWMLIKIPTPRKACKELMLKGDEYEMVYYKKDKF